MEGPMMTEPRVVAPDTHLIGCYLPIPGLGILPVNAFVIRAAEPVLVDTGVVALGDRFFEQICSVIDPADLRYVWITHTDPDHIGCLQRVLEAAPNAKVVTTFLGMGKLGLFSPVPPERVYLLNPGQSLDAGDRKLLALKPPAFDAPETTGLFDTRSRVLFSADCFGGLMTEPADSAAEIPTNQLRDGLVTWTSVDAPWLCSTDEAMMRRALASLSIHAPRLVLSSHLPPAMDMIETLSDYLMLARSSEPFVGPDQAAMLSMLTAA